MTAVLQPKLERLVDVPKFGVFKGLSHLFPGSIKTLGQIFDEST
jgi:hypothetical protein